MNSSFRTISLPAPDPKHAQTDHTTNANLSPLNTLQDNARTARKKELQKGANNALVLLVVDYGIPPSIVNKQCFKNFCAVLNPKYNPPSSTTMRDLLIPAESTNVHLKLIKLLKMKRNLTLSFDRGKSRRPQGLYTITITTAAREAYLYNLHNISYVSHTGEYLFEFLSEICTVCAREVGVSQCADSELIHLSLLRLDRSSMSQQSK